MLIVFFSSATSPRTSTVIFFERSPFATAVVTCGDVAHLRGEVAGERVDVVGQVLPDAGDALHARLAAELAVGADLARDARDFVGERGELVDHRVDGRADAPELALDGLPLDRQLHLLGEIAVGDRVDDAGNLGRGADEVVDQRVERRGRVGPVAGGGRCVRAVGQPAFAADGAADAGDLLAECLAAVGELVERAAEVGADALAGNGEPDAEVAVAGGLERGEQLLELVLRDLASAPFFGAFAPFCAGVPARLRGRAALPRSCFVSDRHVLPPIWLRWVTSQSRAGTSLFRAGFPRETAPQFQPVITL